VHLKPVPVYVYCDQRETGQRVQVVLKVGVGIIVLLIAAIEQRLRNPLPIEKAHERQQPSRQRPHAKDMLKRYLLSSDDGV
jgi:hypothetical protein